MTRPVSSSSSEADRSTRRGGEGMLSLPEGLVTLDRGSDVPLSQQIYRSLREAVRAGHLRAGLKLPSSRSLAAGLGVSRSTLNAALDLLQAEEIIQVRPGSGAVVSSPDLRAALSGSLPDLRGGMGGDSRRSGLSARGALQAENLRGDSWARSPGALEPGTPALDVFPHDLWGRALRRAARHVPGPELLYHEATGHPRLRQVLADYLALERGVKATPEQILVTCGMQALLSCLAQALADPGDLALIEDPGYLGARSAFHGAGLQVRGLPVDEHGADPQQIGTGRAAPKLIYVTPSHHYPFGTRMPLQRRLALIEAVRLGGGLILEDDYDSEFLFDGRPVAALQGLAREGEVIYMGTFSKSFLPGLRLAYCVLPADLVEPMRRVFRQTGHLANVHAQIALAELMEGGEYRAHLKRIRSTYLSRGLRLVEVLREALGNRISVEVPTGNVQVTLTLNGCGDDEALARRLQQKGFAVSPLSPCYVDREAQAGLIVGFAGATERQITAFARELRHCLD
ncbi:PLP-dependent aminotransferase family protein [Roseibium aestuarii]|uniref:PLP-dependent aminotransferase family protein n=1 Tax=Roseibium aestuarii TaxID=2600299 RepID=A0ABW4JY56_9HYPH|nr:PLP-dependent aminotransferase family protein [Roseibium aestuarii]